MVKKEPVNVNWQTVLACIPWVNFFTAYRIEKFRLYFLIWFVVTSSFVGLDRVLEQFEIEWYASNLILIPLSAILNRIWSRQWNEQFIKKTNIDDVKSNNQ